LCTLKHPFEAQNQGALILKIVKGRFEPLGAQYSAELASLVKQCLCRQPNLRPTTEQLINKDIVAYKSRELGIYLDKFTAPQPVLPPSFPTTKDSKGSPQSKDRKGGNSNGVSVKAEDQSKKQVVLRPGGSKARPSSAKPVKGSTGPPPVMLPVQPVPLVLKIKKALVKGSSSKQKEIQAVKNLPTNLTKKKPEIEINNITVNTLVHVPKSPEEPKQEEQKVAEAPPSPEVKSIETVITFDPTVEIFNPQVEMEPQEQMEIVTWRVVGADDSPVSSPNEDTMASKLSIEQIRERLGELSDKSNRLHLDIAKMKGYWVPHVIPKDHFDELFQFLRELRDDDDNDEEPEGGWTAEAIEEADLKREERISKFVQERIAPDNVAVVDDMYRLMFVQDLLDKIQEEINALT
jgi:hypothetical protein